MIIMGPSAPPPAMGDLDPSQLIPDRGELRSETDALLAAIRQLSADQFNADSTNVTQDQLTSWNSFVAEVTSWDSGPDFLAHVIARNWLTELVAYQKQFNAFLAQWQQLGVPTSLAPFTFTSKPGILDNVVDTATNAAKKTLSTIETVAIVGGVVIVGLIGYLIFEGGRTARALGPDVLKVL